MKYDFFLCSFVSFNVFLVMMIFCGVNYDISIMYLQYYLDNICLIVIYYHLL